VSGPEQGVALVGAAPAVVLEGLEACKRLALYREVILGSSSVATGGMLEEIKVRALCTQLMVVLASGWAWVGCSMAAARTHARKMAVSYHFALPCFIVWAAV
jgi:hypothetical protein